MECAYKLTAESFNEFSSNNWKLCINGLDFACIGNELKSIINKEFLFPNQKP